MVHYKTNMLVIELRSVCAGADHQRLMTAINTALRLAISCPERRKTDMEDLIPLFDLQACLLPGEQELYKGKTVHASNTPPGRVVF